MPQGFMLNLLCVGLLGGGVDLFFVLPVLLLCRLVLGLELGHMRAPLFVFGQLERNLCNDLLEIFFLQVEQQHWQRHTGNSQN